MQQEQNQEQEQQQEEELSTSSSVDDAFRSGGGNDDSDAQLSALRENIARKGNNAYYYAHGRPANGPVWDGKEEPRRLDESELAKVEAELLAPRSKAAVSAMASSITEYSWADGKDNVKIYIEVERADEIDDSNVSIVAENASFKFTYLGKDGKEHSLIIGNLHDSIESASFRKKPDKFILTLKKVLATSWFQLKKS